MMSRCLNNYLIFVKQLPKGKTLKGFLNLIKKIATDSPQATPHWQDSND